MITNHAINYFNQLEIIDGNDNKWTPYKLMKKEAYNEAYITYFCAPVIHPRTGEAITQYRKLRNNPTLAEKWTTAFGREFWNLTQGDTKTGTIGENAMFVMSPEQIRKMPRDRVITYSRIVVNFRPQKSDPSRVCITSGGNLLTYPGGQSTKAGDLTTGKLLWKILLSTKNAHFMGIDIKIFYLGTPMDIFEYMKMPIHISPENIIQQYDLRSKSKNVFVYLEIRKAIYGFPSAGQLASQQLQENFRPAG